MKILNIQNTIIIVFFLFSTICSGQNTDLKFKAILENTKKLMQADYTLQNEKICDLNNDQKKDIILLYQPKNVDKEIESFDTPVILILSEKNGFIKIENNNILFSYIPNSSDLDNNLVVKNNYFTIEQSEGTANSRKKKYITFKFDSIHRQIFLSKYGIETSFPGKNKMINKTQIFSVKDFGNIKFEDFDADTIGDILKSK